VAPKILGIARADVLMLNDSPFAQHAYVSNTLGPGAFELLGSGSMTPSIDEKPEREAAFTRTLALMLDSASLASRGVSLIEIHRKLLDNICPTRTSLELPSTSITVNRDYGSSLIVARAKKKNVADIRPYPVYCQLSHSAPLERGTRRNIVLSRLNESLGAEVVVPCARPWGEPPCVKLEMRLERPFLDVQRWKDWILRAPSDTAEVTVMMPRDKDKKKK
jgi:hypothetical protein